MLKTAASVRPSTTTGKHASLASIPSEQQYDKIVGMPEMKSVYKRLQQKHRNKKWHSDFSCTTVGGDNKTYLIYKEKNYGLSQKKTRNSMCIVSHHKHTSKFLELPQTISATLVLFYLFSTPTGNTKTARLQHLQTETAISLAWNFMTFIRLSLSKCPGRFLLLPFCSSS